MGIFDLLFLSSFFLFLCGSLHASNTYNVGDHVPLFVNKIGPFYNPSETYRYYELLFCYPDQVFEKKENLGEVLNGDRLENALYELEFLVNKTQTVLCHQKLDRENVAKFRDAIVSDSYYQMYYDDLPLWAFIGKIENESWTPNSKGPKYFLFTHVRFNALYNGNHVIEIHAFSEPNHVVDVSEDVDINVKFTYSVFWNEISTPYKNRMDRYSGTALLPVFQQIHLFTYVNSFGIVILLMGLLAVLYKRHLKYDLRKGSIGDEEEDKAIGWKHIHGDVFRCPTNLPLLSAVVGSGIQLLFMVFILSGLAFLGILYPYNRGALSSLIFISYILSSALAGYNSISLCNQYSETGREQSVILAGIIFFVPVLFTTFSLNILAAYFGVTAALPLGTIFVIFLLCTLVAVPLLILGAVVGNRYKTEIQSSSITKKIPRVIPQLVWYRKTPVQMFLGGLLPFGAIFMEFHLLCSTIWGHKIYTVPSSLLVTFIILAILTALLSVCLTYFQLAVEDHEWCWRSVLGGGSTALFMFAYCIYFYFKSNMSGILQTSFFFGYSTLMCYAFFLMLGTVSFRVSSMFVRRIYRAVKRE